MERSVRSTVAQAPDKRNLSYEFDQSLKLRQMQHEVYFSIRPTHYSVGQRSSLSRSMERLFSIRPTVLATVRHGGT